MYVILLQITQNHQLQVFLTLLHFFHSFKHLYLSQKAFSMFIRNFIKLRTYLDACQHDYWLKAMKTELDALAANETWLQVGKPPHAKPIGRKWVYKVKHKVDGSIK